MTDVVFVRSRGGGLDLVYMKRETLTMTKLATVG